MIAYYNTLIFSGGRDQLNRQMTVSREDVQEAQLRDLFEYWDDKRGDRVMPRRSEVDPAEIPALLPHIMLVDTAAALKDFRYRLFGTSVCQGFGYDRTGMRFGELPQIENYDIVYSGYWETYAQAKPHYFPGRIVSEQQDYISYSRLTLPLSEGGDKVDMILGGVVFYQTGKRTRWL